MASCSVDVLRRISPPVPAAVAARAAAWSDGDVVAEPAPAASVVLLREVGVVLETYLLHRHARMPFAPSMVVFPGGRMDPVDRGSPDPWRACAVRETVEETGVVLSPEALGSWADWTTPVVEPRRYATRFYVAALPAGQEAADLSGETDRAEWSTPDEALRAEADGRLALMPPTLSILVELRELGRVGAVVEAARDRRVVQVLPEVVRHGEGWRFAYPEEPG